MKIVTDIPKLRIPCVEVTTEDISEIVDNLITTVGMHYGLSANQIGYNLRVFVMKNWTRNICLVNPVITSSKGSQKGEETCLSLPGITKVVKRPKEIKVKGRNQYGKQVKYAFTGLQARVACHEIDHLDGILILDREEK